MNERERAPPTHIRAGEVKNCGACCIIWSRNLVTEFMPQPSPTKQEYDRVFALLLLILHSSDNDDETADLYWAGVHKRFLQRPTVLIKPDGKHQIGWNTMILPNLMRMGDTVGR